MLKELRIQNFALIDKVELSFDRGLCLLTGETGAGKSIIIDGLEAALGGRIDTEAIRTGEEKAIIEGVFLLENHPHQLLGKLEEAGIGLEGDELIFSREITPKGSRCRINGVMVTQAIMKSLGESLVDIFGQHEHQSLLDASQHIELLDSFGGELLLDLKKQVAEAYHHWKAMKEELEKIRSSQEERAKKLEYLNFAFEELTKAELKAEEDQELPKEREILVNAESLQQAAQSSYSALYQGEEQPSLYDGIESVLSALRDKAEIDKTLKPVVENLESAITLVDQSARDLRKYLDKVEVDPERLAQVEERINELDRLKRKYNKRDVQELITLLGEIGQELETLSKEEASSGTLAQEVEEAEEKLALDLHKLSELRKAAAEILKEAVTKELNDLYMEKTRFEASLEQLEDPSGIKFADGKRYKVTEKGADRVEFMISANPGEPLRPLSKVASGGEMARVMLALKSILAKVDKIPVLVFDEIDTGVSGKVAKAMAEKMARLAVNHQLICITHLPSVAAMADLHYHLEKKVKDEKTSISAQQLTEAEHIAELAQMASGSKTSPTAIQHAMALRTGAKQFKVNKR